MFARSNLGYRTTMPRPIKSLKLMNSFNRIQEEYRKAQENSIPPLSKGEIRIREKRIWDGIRIDKESTN